MINVNQVILMVNVSYSIGIIKNIIICCNQMATFPFNDFWIFIFLGKNIHFDFDFWAIYTLTLCLVGEKKERRRGY